MAVEVKNLTKRYGEQLAVNDISFKANKAEIVGFLGPNGAGKSTTMKIITGFLSPSNGTALVNGIDVTKEPITVKKQIGYLPEHNPQYLEMYVSEYLSFSGNTYGLTGKKLKTRIDEVCDKTGLSGKEKAKRIGSLSKGYRQRVGLAQALLHEPEVLILDEPTSGLDPNQIVDIRDLIKEVGKEKTVILSTHIMQEVQAVCDRVIIINKGEIVADGLTEELKSSAKSAHISAEFDQKTDLSSLQQNDKFSTIKHIEEGRYEIIFDGNGKDGRTAIYHWAVANNKVLIGLNEHEKSIEEVFRSLTK